MELIETKEGKTTFFVPVQDTETNFPPRSAAVFFNRRMELNRDATVLLLATVKPQPADYLDAMGATGIRGLRVAHECGIPVTINDRDSRAVTVIKKNVAHRGLSIKVTHRDVNALLSEQRFDAVDLDPFGTPAPFVDAGARSARHYLFVTATDTAPLCGAHLKAGMRRYFSHPMNTDYHSEVGLRTLLGFIAREVIKYDTSIEPIFCFAREHFVRLHLRIKNGAAAADRSLAHVGFILQCIICQYREELPGMIPVTACCPDCGEPLRPIGPLWLGNIQQQGALDRMSENLERMELGTEKDLAKLIEVCSEELPTSSHYDYHRLAKRLVVSPPPIETVLERLKAAGYSATRTHFSGYGIKTEAPLTVILDAISAQ